MNVILYNKVYVLLSESLNKNVLESDRKMSKKKFLMPDNAICENIRTFFSNCLVCRLRLLRNCRIFAA